MFDDLLNTGVRDGGFVAEGIVSTAVFDGFREGLGGCHSVVAGGGRCQLARQIGDAVCSCCYSTSGYVWGEEKTVDVGRNGICIFHIF